MLSDSCMIATFTGKQWSGRKYDASVTRELAKDKHAKNQSCRVNKILMPDEPLMKSIKAKLSEMRHYHYDMTLPWEWKGGQLLPSALFMDYTKQMGKFISEFDAMADKFCTPDYYNKAMEASRITLGDMYDVNDFPRPTDIRSHFYAVIDTDPVPSSGDIRVDLPNEVVNDLKEKWVAKENVIVKTATEHLWQKVHDLAEKFNERTSDPENSFHGTLTSNITEFTDILDKLNIGEDRFLKEVADDMKKLGEYEVDTLRKDLDVRSEAATESASVLEKIKKQMEAFHA